MDGTIREARLGDVPALVDLSERTREEYAAFQPRFWRKAADSRERQEAFFANLIEQGRGIALVHEDDGVVDGFVIATMIASPPVYDPRGLTCLIDDFVVADAGRWGSAGAGLLRAVRAEVQRRGAVQVVVVCPHLDGPKRSLLLASGLSIASEWYVGDV